MAIDIVDVPIKHGEIPSFFGTVYQAGLFQSWVVDGFNPQKFPSRIILPFRCGQVTRYDKTTRRTSKLMKNVR